MSCRSGGTPIGVPHQRRQDFLRAGSSCAALEGRHVKTLRMLRESSGTRGSERPLNPQKADCRMILQLRDGIVFERLSLVLPDQIEAGPVVGRQEGGPDHMRARFHRNRHVYGPVVLEELAAVNPTPV